MRPFKEFRFWAREAPASDLIGTTLASMVVVALLAWLLVPDGHDSSREEVFASGGDATNSTLPAADVAGSESGGGIVPATPTDGAGGGAAGGSGNGGSTGGVPAPSTDSAAAQAPGCAPPPGEKGVTDAELKVTIALVEVVGPAANSLFDIPPPEEQRANYDAAIAGTNKEGGFACRKLVARYVSVNPADESQMMGVCRDIADSDAFALVDAGSMGTRPAVVTCIGQNKIPYFGTSQLTDAARRQFYPYLFAFYYREQVYRSTVFALRDLGFFDPAKGFEKLGFIYRDCERDAIGAFRGWIREVVPDDRVVPYSVGCPAVFANEADLTQAVLTFQREGVTHVTTGNFTGDIARFTAHAEQQRFRPRYGFPDEALLSIAGGTRAPNPDNIANALAVTLTRLGEQQTPGMAPTPGTQKCNAYRQAAGLKPVWAVAATAGQACGQLWMLQQALANVPQLSRAALQVGLHRAKAIDFSFPQGPSDFTGDKVTTGGQFWRLAQFMPSCDCWQVTQRDFRRGPGT